MKAKSNIKSREDLISSMSNNTRDVMHKVEEYISTVRECTTIRVNIKNNGSLAGIKHKKRTCYMHECNIIFSTIISLLMISSFLGSITIISIVVCLFNSTICLLLFLYTFAISVLFTLLYYSQEKRYRIDLCFNKETDDREDVNQLVNYFRNFCFLRQSF